MFCRRFGLLLLLVSVLLPIQLQAEATPSASDISSHLWIADGPDLWRHVTAPSTVVGLDSEETIRALAADSEHGRLFAVTKGSVTGWTLDGIIDAEWTLDDLSEEGAILAQVIPQDGSLWIARGQRLEAFGAYGQALQQLDLDVPVLAMGLDEVTSRLWLMTANNVELRDSIDGRLIRSLDLPRAVKPSLLAVHGLTGRVWLAVRIDKQNELWRLDAAGAVQRTHVLEGSLRHLAVDATGSVWALGRSHLHRFLGEAMTETAVHLESPADDRVYLQLRPRRDDTIWLSDGRWMTRVDADGIVSERHDFGTQANIQGLALIETEEADPTLQLNISFPHEGEIVDTTRPAIALAFKHTLAVDAASVHIDGLDRRLGGQCNLTEAGAVCLLDEELPEGDVNLRVSVADVEGHRSLPKERSFVIDPSFALNDDASEVDEPGADPGLDPSPGDGPSGSGKMTDSVYTPVASPRGIHPEKVYHAASDIDFVDTNSGNLTLRVPLGQTYSVGPRISYQFQLVYNSNIWDHVQTGCPPSGCPSSLEPITFAMASANHNAGFGWEMHFGRLYAPEAPTQMLPFQRQRWPNRGADEPDLTTRWMYVAPDGGTHTLHALTGRDLGSSNLPVRYSKDGSFLRLRQIDVQTMHLQFPDGRVSVFEKTNSAAGTNFCGGNAGPSNATGCWRFQKMTDPYGNQMSVHYAINSSIETWTVSDSTGRSHVLTFDRSDAKTAGGDGSGDFTTEQGDEWGDLVRVLTKVDLAAFGAAGTGGSRAIYNLTHHNERFSRGCPHSTTQLPASALTQRVPVLDVVSIPGSQPWRFGYIEGDAANCSYTTGRLDEFTLPTRGKIKYQWAINKWDEPTRCVYDNDPDAEFWMRSTGIFKRHEIDAAGITRGTWTYTSQLMPPQEQLVRSGNDCTRATYRETDVSSPAGYDGVYKLTRFFNAVTGGPRTPVPTTAIRNWQVTDQGLPLTKSLKISANNSTTGGSDGTFRFLSRQVFECQVGGGPCPGNAQVPERDTWVRCASEWRPCMTILGDSPGCYQVNPLRTAEHHRYRDDGNRYTDSENLRYDGAGHFERRRMDDNFNGTLHERIEDTLYGVTGTTLLNISSTTGYVDVGNPASYLPAVSASWILTPYSRQTVIENGRTYVSDHVFDDKGSLKCSRQRKNGGTQGPNDRVVALTFGGVPGRDAGLPVTEIVAGGDQASLGTGACNVNAGASAGSRYEFTHTFQFGSLASSRLGSNQPFRYRADIDKNTGLPHTTYSPADQPTTYQFDALSRPIRIFPPLGAADTWITYSSPANNDAFITTEQRQGSAILTSSVTTYDWNGRPILEKVRRPTGPSTWSQSVVETRYDPAGRVERTTTRQPSGGVAIGKATVYSEYDVFDRPGRIKRADGSVENRSYSGIRVVSSTVQVRTSDTGTSSVTTTSIRDAQGRTVQVSNPEYNTFFEYDPFGQQLSVRRNKGSFNQIRSYDYDGRGFLSNEYLPEIDGAIGYVRDAFGMTRNKASGQHHLTYIYDGDARLTQVKDAFGGRVWKEWVYGASNSGNDIRKGQLVQAVRHNYPFEVDWSIVETYKYAGIGGQLSQKTSQLQWPANPTSERYGAYFETGYAYDGLGNLTSLDYPRCLPTPQNGQNRCTDGSNDQTAPVHILSHTYSSGHPWSSQSSLGLSAQATYHPNLQLATLTYGNGVLGTFQQGYNGLARSRRFNYSKDSVDLFETFLYEYDGAGNIWKIGNDRYVYDKSNRLKSGTVVQAPGSGQKEEYTYDAADNIRSLKRDGGLPVTYTIDANTNRLLGNHDIVYDPAGQMLEVGPYVGGQPRFEMEYDAQGMQTRFISRQSGFEADYRYLYGPGDRRLVTFDTMTSERVFKLRGLGDEVLREYKVNGWGSAGSGSPGEGWVHVKDFLYGPEGIFATRQRQGNTTYFHKDHLGTPRALTDGNGTLIGRHDYYPFGTEIPRSD